jgi:hypothetical protein
MSVAGSWRALRLPFLADADDLLIYSPQAGIAIVYGLDMLELEPTYQQKQVTRPQPSSIG